MGLKRPTEWSCGAAPDASVEAGPTSSPLGGGGFADRAADASRSSPLTAAGLGEKTGSVVMAERGGSEPSGAWPAVEWGDKCSRVLLRYRTTSEPAPPCLFYSLGPRLLLSDPCLFYSLSPRLLLSDARGRPYSIPVKWARPLRRCHRIILTEAWLFATLYPTYLLETLTR